MKWSTWQVPNFATQCQVKERYNQALPRRCTCPIGLVTGSQFVSSNNGWSLPMISSSWLNGNIAEQNFMSKTSWSASFTMCTCRIHAHHCDKTWWHSAWCLHVRSYQVIDTVVSNWSGLSSSQVPSIEKTIKKIAKSSKCESHETCRTKSNLWVVFLWRIVAAIAWILWYFPGGTYETDCLCCVRTILGTKRSADLKTSSL